MTRSLSRPVAVFLVTLALSELVTFTLIPRGDSGILLTLAGGFFFWLVNPFFGAAITIFSGLLANKEGN